MTARQQVASLFAMSAAVAAFAMIVGPPWNACYAKSRHRRSVRNSRSDTREPSPKAHADYKAWVQSHHTQRPALLPHHRRAHRT